MPSWGDRCHSNPLSNLEAVGSAGLYLPASSVFLYRAVFCGAVGIVLVHGFPLLLLHVLRYNKRLSARLKLAFDWPVHVANIMASLKVVQGKCLVVPFSVGEHLR